MKTSRPLWISVALVSTFSLAIITQLAERQRVTAQQAGQPKTAGEAFKNIRVIKSMPAADLQSAMSFMTISLGVECSYCHTPPAMEKDEKPAKETARRMLAMVSEINRNFGEKPVVNCATCHHGQTKPAGLPPLKSLKSPFVENTIAVKERQLPTVDQILDRYTKALGGAQALDKVTTRTRKGAVEVSGVRGSFELYEVAPNKSLLIGSLPPPLGSVQQAFDGSHGWVKNQNGVFDMSGPGLAQTGRESAFYGDIKLREQFQTMNVAGREQIDGRDLYVLVGTRPDGQLERLFFDSQTGLLVRRYWERPSFFGPLPNANDYDDYRKVGSVLLPFTMRKERGGTTFLQTVTEYKLNVQIDESKFQKPAAQK